MNTVIRISRVFGMVFWYSLAAFVVTSAVVLTTARLLLPNAHQYTRQVESILSRSLGMPVRIGQLDAQWYRFGPVLVVKNVQVLDLRTQKESMRFAKARLNFDLWSLAFHGQLGLRGATISGMHIRMERTTEGSFQIVGMDSAASDESTFNNQTLQNWLFGELQWDIEDSTLEWRDWQRSGQVLRFSDVQMSLRNNGAHHRLEGTLRLPGHLGEQVVFAWDVRGDPLKPDSWYGRSYAGARNIDLASVARETQSGRNTKIIKTGHVDFQIWSQWEGGLQRAIGEFAVRDLGVDISDENKTYAAFARIAGSGQWQRREQGWALDIERFMLTRDGDSWPETRLHVVSSAQDPRAASLLQAQASFIRMQDAAVLLLSNPQLSEEWRSVLHNLRPRGELRGMRFDYRNANDSVHYRASAEVLGVGVDTWKTWPGITALSGVVSVADGKGAMELNGDGVVLDLPQWFRAPLQLGTVRGAVNWNYEGGTGAWRMTSTDLAIDSPDGKVQATLDISAADSHSTPYLDIVAALQDGNARHTFKYLPVSIMPSSVVGWLDRAIMEGSVPDAMVVVHGGAHDFPYANGNGRFEVRAHVVRGVLDYMADWPRIADIDADLLFLGRGMHVTGHSATLLNSDINNIEVAIADMRSPEALLTIDGHALGETQEKIAYLQASPPLNQKFGRHLRDMSVQGVSDLHLKLDIPIGRALSEGVKVNAQLQLADNTLNMGSWGPLLTQANGSLRINNDGIQSDKLSALVLDQPAKLEIKTLPTAGGAQLSIKSKGTLNPARLAARLQPGWSDYFQGKGRWEAHLRLPFHAGGEGSRKLHVKAVADDVRVNLPAPVGKAAGESLLVELDANLAQTTQKLYLQYGQRFSAALQLASAGPGDYRVGRGEVQFGKGTAVLPQLGGLRLSGALQHCAFDEWQKVLATATPEPPPQQRMLHDADLYCEQATAYGQLLHELRLKVLRGGKEWRIGMQSLEIAGQIKVPFDGYAAPIVLDMERLRYVPAKSFWQAQGTSFDPRRLPAVEIKSQKFNYANIDFGNFQMKASKFAQGWRVDKLEMTTPITQVNGFGTWTFDGKQHQSKFDLDVSSEDIGSTMTTFGYAGAISGGEGQVVLKSSWAAPLPDVVPEIIDGTLALSFKKGRMLDVSPGAGRLFALLSLQALPRRLALDFSDLFAKGFGFDDIKGEFRFEHGEAYTNNLVMKGPAAKVHAAGRVGLAEHDYDQLVRIVPNITGSVPTLTTIALSPQIGLVTYVLGKIFQSQIDQATGIEYTISGSWENPNIQRIVKTSPDSAVNN